ncbi:MAG TPA: hypothetical protein VMH40_00755 [Myxococcaceae bacterium]|nr:hypothetical protein [Myxococcaceae bacterium]
MTFGKRGWLLVPLSVVLGCASTQQAQKPTASGGSSTLVDEGASSTKSAQAAPKASAPTLVPFQGNGGFVVLMPPNPRRDEQTQDTPGGQVKMHIAQAQDVSGRYLSSASDFPAGSLDRIGNKDLLDSLQQTTVQSMGGTLVDSHDVGVAGYPGREFTATDPQGSQVTARVFVAGSRVYTLAGTYPQGDVPGSIRQFLESFQPPAGAAVGGSGPDTGEEDTVVDPPANEAADGATSGEQDTREERSTTGTGR